MSVNFIFTSESVCAGHPDKICDQISDAIVDKVLGEDANGRVAVETLVSENQVVLAGEVNYQGGKINYQKIVQEQIRRLGYTDNRFRFTDKSPITVNIHQQSSEIAAGVDNAGAGDQGMMFGYACNETDNLMPMPIELAHQLTMKVDYLRESKKLPYLRPDGKSQVSVRYENGKPVSITKVVLAVPHDEQVELGQVKKDLLNYAVKPVLKSYNMAVNAKDFILNGTGIWHIGGPASDTGVTGRKIVVDTYGGYARVGGGAFSGKDATKVDRSGAYAARFIAKNIVAQGLADRAEVRLAYFIGAKKSLMQEVETFGTSHASDKKINDYADNLINTSVSGILKRLDLQRPQYLPTAAYGHFGRQEFSWEQLV
jgi:S-adenosylmethionine synthetase